MAETKQKPSLKEKLIKIQAEMKVPKDLYNSFGKYKYRNAESIMEAFKPLGKKYGATLIITDDVVVINARYYVESMVTLFDTESDETIVVSAKARESETKKGMDDSQVTGATSSYARKYALNGLFLLDDTKDADSDEFAKETGKKNSAQSTQSKAATAPNNTDNSELIATRKQIVDYCTKLGGTKNTEMMSVLKAVVSNGNPNAIKDINKAKQLLEKLKTMKPLQSNSEEVQK